MVQKIMPENFCFDHLIRNFMVFNKPKAQSHKNSRILKMFKNFQFFSSKNYIAEIPSYPVLSVSVLSRGPSISDQKIRKKTFLFYFNLCVKLHNLCI